MIVDIKAFVHLLLLEFNNLIKIEMLESLNPFQQLVLGVSSVGIIMILIVVFLTASPNFENTDRLKKIIDIFENKK